MNSMKRFFALAFTIIIALSGSAQTEGQRILMQIADEEVTVADFLYVYKKNNPVEGEIDANDLQEYLDLYVNFRLKVKEAKELGMDTTATFMKELSGYRKQLAQPYFIDESVNEHLLQEAYERMQFDIRASHILIKAPENAAPEDTLTAYNSATWVISRFLTWFTVSKPVRIILKLAVFQKSSEHNSDITC